MKKSTNTPKRPARCQQPIVRSWFHQGWVLASCSTYLGPKRMTYAAFRQAIYRGDSRHPKLATMKPGDGCCKASISPKGYTPRTQFNRAWDIFMEWFGTDRAFQLLIYLPSNETEIVAGHDLAGGCFHRWPNDQAVATASTEYRNH